MRGIEVFTFKCLSLFNIYCKMVFGYVEHLFWCNSLRCQFLMQINTDRIIPTNLWNSLYTRQRYLFWPEFHPAKPGSVSAAQCPLWSVSTVNVSLSLALALVLTLALVRNNIAGKAENYCPTPNAHWKVVGWAILWTTTTRLVKTFPHCCWRGNHRGLTQHCGLTRHFRSKLCTNHIAVGLE